MLVSHLKVKRLPCTVLPGWPVHSYRKGQDSALLMTLVTGFRAHLPSQDIRTSRSFTNIFLFIKKNFLLVYSCFTMLC